jgi:hypothetical protein
MTVKAKPVAYPNLLETMKSVVDSHKQVHVAVVRHAAVHTTTLQNRRQQLSVRREAARLMKRGEKE